MSLIIPLERTLPLKDIIKIKFHELAVFRVHERLDIDIQLISGDFMNGRARLIVKPSLQIHLAVHNFNKFCVHSIV